MAKQKFVNCLIATILSFIFLFSGVAPVVSAQSSSGGTITIGYVSSPPTGNFNYFAGGAGGTGFPPGTVNVAMGHYNPSSCGISTFSCWAPLLGNITVGPVENLTYAQIAQNLNYKNYTGLWGPSGYNILNTNVTLYKWINFTVSPGMKFSNGEPLTSANVLTELNLNEAPGSANMVPGTNVGAAQSNYTGGVNIDWATSNGFYWWAPNNSTVSIVYATSLSDARLIFSNYPMPSTPFSSFTNETQLKDFKWTDPIGMGPWVLKSWTPTSETFTPNPYWTGTKPKASTLVIDFFSNTGAAETALTSGAIQALNANIPDMASVWNKTATQDVWTYQSNQVVWLGLNQLSYPFNVTAFRQAIYYAINRTYIADVPELGYAIPANTAGLSQGEYAGFLTSATRAALNPYTTNDTTALTILKGLGFKMNSNNQLTYPNGTALSFTMQVNNALPDQETTATAIANMLSNIGISVSVQPLQSSILGRNEQTGVFQMMLIESGGFTPWSTWQYVMNPQFLIGYCNAPQLTYPLAADQQPNTPPHCDLSGDFVRYWNVTFANLFNRDNGVISPAARTADFNTMALGVNSQLPLLPMFQYVNTFLYSTAQWQGWTNAQSVYNMGPADNQFYGYDAALLTPASTTTTTTSSQVSTQLVTTTVNGKTVVSTQYSTAQAPSTGFSIYSLVAAAVVAAIVVAAIAVAATRRRPSAPR